jgi:hypothetical protein
MAEKVSPQQVGYLNPSVESGTSDYTGFSRGIEAPRSQRFSEGQSQALRGLPELWTNTNNTVNRVFERDIEQTVDDVVDRTNAVMNNSDLPDGVKRGTKQMDNLSAARAQGTITEEAYWQRMEALVRGLGSKYEGHAQYARDYATKRLGKNPANVLRENRFEAMSKGGDIDPATKLMKEVGQHVDPGTLEEYRQGKVIPVERIIYESSKNQAAKAQLQFDEGALKVEDMDSDKRKRLAGESLALSYSYVMNTEVGSEMKGLHELVQLTLKEGNTWSDEQYQKIHLQIMAKKQALVSRFRQVELGLTDISKINYAEYMDEKEMEQKRAPYLGFIDAAADAVVGKNPTLIKASADLIQGMLDKEGIRTFNKVEALKRIAAIGSRIPPQVMNDAMYKAAESGNVDVIRAVDKAKVDLGIHVWGGLVVPANPSGDPNLANPSTFTNSMSMHKTEMNGETFKFTTDQISNSLAHKDTPMDVKGLTAERLFDDPVGLLEQFSGKDVNAQGQPNVPARFTAWNIVNTPKMAATMQEIRDQHPDGTRIYAKYRDYMITGTNVMGGKAIADTKDIIIDDRYKVTMDYDEKSHTFKLNYTQVPEADRRAFKANWDAKVEQFNMAIRPLADMFKAEGGDVDAQLLGTLQALGFDKDEEKRTTAVGKSLWNMMKGAALSAKTKMGKLWLGGAPVVNGGVTTTTTTMEPSGEFTDLGLQPNFDDDSQPRLNNLPGYVPLIPVQTELEGVANELNELMQAVEKDPTPDNIARFKETFREFDRVRKKFGVPSPVPARRMEPTSGSK